MSKTRTRSVLPWQAWLGLGVLAVLALVVLAARWAWALAPVAGFVARYPGVASGAELTGTPAWVATLHGANVVLMSLAVRSGISLSMGGRPAGHWTRRVSRRARARGVRTSPITLEQWFHVAVDLAWLACGLAYVVLLVSSGRWVRLVPQSLDVLPNALSVVLQYLALEWPTESGWVAYNALQMLGYALVVFVLAPLAVLSGLRTSVLWPARGPLGRMVSEHWARSVHLPVMVGFIAFVVVHVGLVLASGAVRTLNHMFGARNDTSPVGVLVALGVIALAVVAWSLVRPSVLRTLGAVAGTVTR